MTSPYSPSRPTVTRDRLERVGMFPNCLLQNTLFLLSVMGRIAWNTSNPPVLSLYVLCIPSYCTVDGLRTTVHYTGVFCGTNKLVTLPVHNHWIGIKVQWWIISWVTLCVACFLCVGITCGGAIQEVRNEKASCLPGAGVLCSSAEALLLPALSFGVLLRNEQLRNIVRMSIYSEF